MTAAEDAHVAPALVAVNWGSDFRHLFALDAAGATLHAERDGPGVLGMAEGGFEEAVDRLRARWPGATLVMAGMVGSDRGWVETGYASCPAGPAELAARAVRPRAGVVVLPGVASDGPGARADVMRGEEARVLGAVEGGWAAPDGLVCAPGAHAKWVRVRGGRIASFRTSMAGEVFAHLKRGGILSGMLGVGDATAEQPFREGVATALRRDDVLRELFHARARAVLGQSPADGVAAYVRGLLIGDELRVALREADGPVALVGAPEAAALYSLALDEAGRSCSVADGDQAFVLGVRAVAAALSGRD